ESSVAAEDHPSLASGWQATTEIRSRQVPRTCHRRLLQQNRPKADSCSAANSGLYSITSSARTSSVDGTLRPSALAVLRLMTSSNLVGCSTGSSEGFAPLRILST